MNKRHFDLGRSFGSCSRWLAGAFWLAALASGCGDVTPGQPLGTTSEDETLEQSVGVVTTQGRDAGRASDAGVASDGGASWCAVKQIMTESCTVCHDGEGTAGSPMGLTKYEDFFADSPLTPGKKVYETVALRVHDTRRPMPPRRMLPADKLKVIDDWVAAGAPSGAPDGGVPSCSDAGVP